MAVEIATRAKRGNGAARATLSRHVDRLARGLSHVVNIIDPDAIVLGGGLSHLSHLYEQLPQLMRPHIFADQVSVEIKQDGETQAVCKVRHACGTCQSRTSIF
jgi:fructokinase